MTSLTGVKIKTTTYPESFALQSFYSYTLNNTPFYFKVSWNPYSGDDYKSKFSNNAIVWDFGDGTYYTGPTAQHVYEWPGKYNVKATFYDIDGNVYTIKADEPLYVYNAIPDKVDLGGLDNGTNVVYNLLAGRRSDRLKLIRYNSWQYDRHLKDNNYTVYLNASGSMSTYLSVSSYYASQWGHLISYFGFIEKTLTNANVLYEKLVDSTLTTSVSLYAERVNTGIIDGRWGVRLNFYSYPKDGTVFCGTSGTELSDRDIYFVDQRPSGDGKDSVVVLYATLDSLVYKDTDYIKYNYFDTEPYGVINSTWSAQVVKTMFNSASSLAITSNGITLEGATPTSDLSAQKIYTFDIYPLKYANTNVSFVITLKDAQGYTTKCYPMLNLNNTEDLEIYDIKVSVMEALKTGYRELSGISITRNYDVPQYLDSGSYFAGHINSPYEVQAAAISAIALVVDRNLPVASKNNFYIMQPGLNQYRKFNITNTYGYSVNIDNFTVGEFSNISTNYALVSGGINITYVPGYLINPLSGEYVWITNADNDKVILHDGDGNQRIPDIDLRKLPVLLRDNLGRIRRVTVDARGQDKSAKPCNIAVNSNGDAWLTLYDTVTSYKLDKNTGAAISLAVPPIDTYLLNISLSSSDLYKSQKYKGFVGENLILPTGVDVDKQDNVYITYSHPLCSFISKYNSEGTHLKTYYLSEPNAAKHILVDLDNNIWVSTFTNSSPDTDGFLQSQRIVDRKDKVYCISQNNNTIKYIEISMPGEITLDSYGRVWVYNKNNTLSNVYLVDNNIHKKDAIIGNKESVLDYVQDFGGVAGDMNGNLLLISNTESSLYYYNTNNFTDKFLEELPYNDLPGTGLVDPVYNSPLYYQTFGDFTGLRWYLKNAKQIVNVPRYITGTSSLFTIKPIKSVVVKKNENYDLANTIKSYVLQESMFNNTNLFDNMFSPILNGNVGDLDELGKVIYEKISNYTNNISDIDKCNISSLKSMYSMVGENLEFFNSTVPPSLRRLIDILSVKKCLLFGNKNYYNRRFSEMGKKFDPYNNLGEEISVSSGHFTPGYPIVTYEKFSKRYRLVTNTMVPEEGVEMYIPYPLSGVNVAWGWGLVVGEKNYSGSKVGEFYKFYNFIPTSENSFYDGLIDFNDPGTTISPYSSGYSEWIAFAGQMDNILGSNLYQNLGLVNYNT